MKRAFLQLVLIATLFSACAEDSDSQIAISDVQILAPAIGAHASVAYFSISNDSDDMVTVSSISSPQFGSVEIHETTLDDGVSRMRRIDSIEVAGRSRMSFSPGGKHIMLMQPATDVNPGTMVTLEIQIDGSLLLVSTELQDRISPN